MRTWNIITGLVFLGSGLIAHADPITTPNALYGNEQAAGFKKMYDGTRADFNNNWVDYQQNNSTTTGLSVGWAQDATENAMTCHGNAAKQGCGTDLRSKVMYKDFDLRLSYKCDGNQGVFYRGLLRGGKSWDTAVEFAVDEDVAQNDKKVLVGAAYAVYEPSSTNPYHSFASATPWNEVRIIAIGDSVEHWLNGVLVVKYKYFSTDYMARYRLSKWYPGNNMSFAVQNDQSKGPILEGYLGFQGDHPGRFWVRNIRINTAPTWNDAYQWPPAPTGISKTTSAATQEAAVRIAYQGANVELSIPGVAMKKASLVDLAGHTQALASITGEGSARFASMKRDGVYFVKYENTAGAVHSAKISLLSPR